MLLSTLAAVVLMQEPAPQAVSQDWALIEAPDRNAVLAVTSFDSGIILSARCVNGIYDVTINGLPRSRTVSRELRVSIGNQAMETETWTVGDDPTAAFSRLPAFLARRLAKGGQLQIGVPGAGGRPGTRYVMDLPPSPTVLQQTLTACGRPLVDPRDQDMDPNAPDGLSGGVTWGVMPRVPLPDSVNGRYVENASVSVSCVVTSEGRLRDCVIESEHPPGYRFGAAVSRALRGGRVRLTEDGGPPLEGRLVTFTVVFSES